MNRYTNIRPTKFDDIPLFSPNFEALDKALAGYQQSYDMLGALAAKAPKGLSADSPAIANFMGGIRDEMDTVVNTFTEGNTRKGRKAMRDLTNRVTQAWTPGGFAYQVQENLATKQEWLKEQSERLKKQHGYVDPQMLSEAEAYYDNVYKSKGGLNYDDVAKTYNPYTTDILPAYADLNKKLDTYVKAEEDKLLQTSGWQRSKDGKYWFNTENTQEVVTRDELMTIGLQKLAQDEELKAYYDARFKYGMDNANLFDPNNFTNKSLYKQVMIDGVPRISWNAENPLVAAVTPFADERSFKRVTTKQDMKFDAFKVKAYGASLNAKNNKKIAEMFLDRISKDKSNIYSTYGKSKNIQSHDTRKLSASIGSQITGIGNNIIKLLPETVVSESGITPANAHSKLAPVLQALSSEGNLTNAIAEAKAQGEDKRAALFTALNTDPHAISLIAELLQAQLPLINQQAIVDRQISDATTTFTKTGRGKELLTEYYNDKKLEGETFEEFEQRVRDVQNTWQRHYSPGGQLTHYKNIKTGETGRERILYKDVGNLRDIFTFTDEFNAAQDEFFKNNPALAEAPIIFEGSDATFNDELKDLIQAGNITRFLDENGFALSVSGLNDLGFDKNGRLEEGTKLLGTSFTVMNAGEFNQPMINIKTNKGDKIIAFQNIQDEMKTSIIKDIGMSALDLETTGDGTSYPQIRSNKQQNWEISSALMFDNANPFASLDSRRIETQMEAYSTGAIVEIGAIQIPLTTKEGVFNGKGRVYAQKERDGSLTYFVADQTKKIAKSPMSGLPVKGSFNSPEGLYKDADNNHAFRSLQAVKTGIGHHILMTDLTQNELKLKRINLEEGETGLLPFIMGTNNNN